MSLDEHWTAIIADAGRTACDIGASIQCILKRS